MLGLTRDVGLRREVVAIGQRRVWSLRVVVPSLGPAPLLLLQLLLLLLQLQLLLLCSEGPSTRGVDGRAASMRGQRDVRMLEVLRRVVGPALCYTA